MSEAVSSESKSSPLPLTRSSVLAAHRAIEGQIHRTPVLTSSSLSASLPGANTLYFKAENFQRGGAFKFRGASYSLACLTPDELAKGVCTHSSGESKARLRHAGSLRYLLHDLDARVYCIPDARLTGIPIYFFFNSSRKETMPVPSLSPQSNEASHAMS